jgi:transposase InsO family protein
MAEVLGISELALRRWQQRQRAAPSRPAPLGRPKVISREVRDKIRQCYRDHHGQWGPRTLAYWCRRQGLGTWCASTVAAVIADLRDKPEEKSEPIRYEITAPQVMWSEDGTGFKEKGRKRELLIAQDEHARFKVNTRLVVGPAREEDVVFYLEEAFQRYGPPLVIKHDGDSIFHGDRMREFLDRYEVIALTGPRSYPQYNGKKERSIRDVKSYERALRRSGRKHTLRQRLDEAIHDLNEERPRPVLAGRTAREVFTQDSIKLPDRQRFRKEVDQTEECLLAAARSRSEQRRARRRAIEMVLLRYSFMKESGDVSRNHEAKIRTD